MSNGKVSTFLLMAVALAAGPAGCSAPVHRLSLSAWKQQCLRYLDEQANGDPNALADLTDGQDRPGFVLLGHPDPDKATDYYGLLVGLATVGKGRAYVFLVAEVKKARLEAVVPMVLQVEESSMRWWQGKRYKPATEQYRRAAIQAWRRRHGPDMPTGPFYGGFPRPEDVFTVQADQASVAVVHPASGARWTVPVGRTD